ncbi:Fe-S cluster assembly protein SufD [Lysobacter sp. 5GHs7-4]|uniref:Fe-S cluster assembly protein SufD n=1 Tax=Lysobacter sp. 5GHs7-4 TaxID=2904253 RepID=UPI001E53E0FC|nr:Fe-S cluster assembly protein SufD [Lysobacter sp. 5GHs7-4]UHQ25229.1 Fe-S cluster assembly protein SufD [Lysobacter sp. 5GHs7-4]
MDAALRAGLPHARSEAWKYTPLRNLERRRYAAPQPGLFDAALLAAIPAPRLVFNNGRYDAALSDLGGLAAGVSLRPLSQVLAEDDARASNFLERRYERPEDIFARVNAALAEDGAVLKVAAGTQGGSVHLVFVGAPVEGDIAWHLRNLIELQEGASLTVVEHQLGGGEHSHLGNSVSHVHLATRAALTHARVQDEAAGAVSMARTDAVLSREAVYRRLDLELGAALSRHELNVALHGEAARVHANGVLLATGKRHLDTRLGIDHVGRDSACDLVWRGMGAGRSRAAFHGGILIREGADGTAAMLSNKNLLLSEGAEIDTQPVLEIHADEVQAAHGATVGQLDANALFYLRSRGVPAEQARALLTAAFCRETLSVFDDAGLRALLEARLDTALSALEAGTAA